MIFLRLRLGISLSLGCLGLGLFFLNDYFENSGKDVLIIVLVAPVLCALGLVLLWTTLKHHKKLREWERYCRDEEGSTPVVRQNEGTFAKLS